MRSFCGSLLTLIVVLSISLAAAIAMAAIISSMASNWSQDEERPRIFAILNMLGVITRRIFDRPDIWVSAPIKSRCACATGKTDENVNQCAPNDPCNPGAFPLSATVHS